VAARGAALGIGVTAVLFSAKHAIIDASMGRALAIAAGGVVLGWVAHAGTWKVSAISHVTMNTIATALLLGVQHLAPPACMTPQPVLSPELRGAIDRSLALADAPDSKEIEALFAPSYLKRFPVPETVGFFQRVGQGYGHCEWSCATAVDDRNTTGLLLCKKGVASMRVHVEATPPHRVDLLSIRPTYSRP